MRTRKKRATDMPPRVKFFIDSVISTPLENIEAPLSHFDWDYGKGDFHHWVDLVNHFKSFFEKHVKTRKDLQLDGDFLESDTPFPKQAVLQILRVTRIILDNCTNKYLYSAQEHLALLLASTDVEITVAALQTLAALVKKPTHSNRTVRWHGDPTMNQKLFSLSQGWGGKEEGLGLVACSTEDGCGADACLLGSTLHFEFYANADVSVGNFEAKNQRGMSGLQIIHIPELHLNPKSDLELLKHLCDTYQVPVRLRFSLLTRLRFARAFHSVVTRRYYLCIRLLAFTVLLQSNPDHEDLAAFFVNEPEFVNELVTLLQSEENVPEDIRILAIRALAALAQDRPRQSNVLSVVSAGGHRGILPGLVQKAVVSMTSGVHDCSVAFVESLLGLVTILVSSSSGSSALREAGLIPTLLPLLKYNNPHHVDLVASAVHILEAFMDYSNPAGTLFRDLGGLDDAVARLHYEVIRVKEAGAEQCEDMDTSVKGKSVSVESNEHEKTVNHEPVRPYQQRILLKALLRAIALGTYSLDNASRLHGCEEDALPSCLSMIFKHAKKFGGGVFSLAASVMSDLINKDPTCFPALHAAGLPGAFLDSIIAGVLPSSDAVGCIPHALDALCLNQTGLQAVKDSNALHCFVDIFTSKAYVRALSGDTPGSVASGLDELMRHAPSLRDPGIDVCIKILNKIAVIGGMSEELSVPLPETGIVDTPIPMDTDLDENAVSPTKEESSSAAFFSSNEAAHENIETFLLECINNTVQLLETILQNSDTGRVFIEKKGIEALLKLFTLPGLPINFGASLTACNMCSTFRAFSSQHAANLTRILCVTLRRHLEKTLENVGSVSNLKLLDLPNEVQKTVVQDLCALECFVAVAANLVRNLGPMLIELGNAGIDIITNIGKVHRWVLWQISAADDSKVDSKQDDEPENTGEENAGINGGSDVVNRESEENRDSANTSQYINPVSSVTSHSSHWSIEPEFLPLLQMEQGPGRRARRDHGTTAHILSHVARLGRLARHARVVRADTDGLGRPVNESRSQEPSKHKSSETLIYEMMARLAGATRGLYIAMGKAMVVPSRRRDDSVTVTPAAKSVAAALAILIHDHLSFEGCGSSSGDTMSVKCKYLGKVIEDITAVVMDTRRRTCNTVMVNTLYAHGAIKEVLTTFAFACQVLWASACLMDSEAAMEDSSKPGDKTIAPSWLLNTIQCYSRLLDCLVTSSLLLTPSAMGQLLVQSVTQGTIPIPKTPEALVLKMQTQVLEVVLPLWTHPMLAQTNADLITAVSSVIMHIYSGVSDIKLQRGSGSGSTGARLIVPPPDESLISVIAEMGFSRSRAEEALRRVGTNSVEMAMEWLLNHPEEASQEEDELARALALSLGNGSDSGKEDDGTKARQMMAEEVELQLPPIENMLSVCMNLLKSFDAVAFPLTDLLVTICTRSKGQNRSRIIIYLIEQIRLCKLEESGSDFSPLSSVSHLLALLLNEDSLAREVAAGNGLVVTVLGVLTDYVSAKTEGGREETPKWVATLLLVLDNMLQYRPKTGMDDEPSAKIQIEDGILDVSIPDSQQHAVTRDSISGKEHIKPWESILGKPSAYMTNDEQQRTMTLVCKLLQMKLPTTFMHAIFQLCARLTKVYSMAVQFLETGGLSALLSLPRSCLFPGFDSIAASIIRHLLEDPHTLQQAMESEIKHSLAATLNRHHGRVSPRTFLTLMASVILRDPAIFSQAAAAVCRIERIGDRPYVVLAKEKDKEKDREKEKAPDKEKAKTNTEEIHDTTTSSNGCKVSESLPKTGKGHKKISPSFSHVVEQLLDVILHFAPSPEDECLHSKASISNFVTPMEIDDVACRDKGKAKLEENRLPEKNNMSETSASLAKVSFILKLMTEVVIMYSSAASVVLRRDAESSQGRGPIHAGSQAIGHGGLIYHVLHRLLPHSEDVGTKKLTLQEWTEKLSIKASNFLMAICVRSSEGRRRIFSEITKALTIASSKFETSSGEGSARPDKTVRSFVDFLNNVLSPQASPGSIPAPGLSTEMAKAMLDVGLVHALTMILKEIDLDHPDTPKFVNGIVKVLEALTRVAASSVDQAVTSEGADTRKEVSGSEMLEVVGNDTSNGRNSGAGPQGALDVHSRDGVIGDSVQADLQIAIRAMQALVGDTSRYEHMDDDIRLGREAAVGVHLEVEEEFMQEADGAVGITVDFNMDHGGRDEEDEEEMDGDNGDEDDGEEEEEEEDADNFEEEEEAHLSLPDTDVEDHELEDEYDEDMAEEEDEDDDVDDEDEEEEEDDDWRENRVIEVRWRDGLTGVSRVQVLGHTAEGNVSDFPIDPFQGLSVEDLFGAFRRTSGSDQRRSSTYRPFFERTSSDRGRSFRHPLLTRPNLPTVAGSNGVPGNPLSNSSGTISRDTEVLLGGDMDVTHFYMYDGPILTGDTSNGVAESRVIASQNPSFFEFSLDPAYRFGRRRARTDSRFNNWSDNGQPQGVAQAAAIAQALEENFIAQLGNSSSDEDQNSGQPNAVGDAPIGSAEREVIREVEGDASGRIEQASASESHACRHIIESGCGSGPAIDGNVSLPSTDDHPGQVPNADLDVPMHVHINDDRTEHAGRDVEIASQDSSESGATVGESLRSLEVEIGSADGHDEGERHAGTDRLNAGEVPLREVLHRRMVIEDSGRQTDDMDDTDGARLATPQAERRVEISANLCNLSDSVPGGTDANDGLGGNGPVNMSSIDPAFLEALPEDLRAEVLASQQNQAATATDHQPSIEEIDPEFLAALPPEIQAEVLAQQQAQRLLQVQQMEGQPVDMDSASIIATFPEDLREEVLLTSSESVLAALPPALLAEAQLLRERAISQYNVRTLFGDVHRTGGRRNSTASGTRGTFTSIDRGVGSGSALTSGRRISSTHIDGSKGREADGKPLVDVAALKAMLRLLRLAQPLGKGLLQRLLLNLCAHNNTRVTLVQLLLDMLRPDVQGYPFLGSSADGAPPCRLYGCQWNVVYSRPQLSDGVPPLVSRRVLEILTYLARNQSLVANSLLYFEPASSLVAESGPKKLPDKINQKGKTKLCDADMSSVASDRKSVGGEVPLSLLLKLLNQPLYLRSNTHLEQVMGLLEVVTSNAASMVESQRGSPDNVAPPINNIDLEDRHDDGRSSEPSTPLPSELPDGVSGGLSIPSMEIGRRESGGTDEGSCPKGVTEASKSGFEQTVDAASVILGLATQDLCHLCLLLACEGLSEVAYSRIAEILKKIAKVAPPHRRLFITELANAAKRLSGPGINELLLLGETETVVVSTASMVGGAILRVLLALSALILEYVSKEKDHGSSVEKEREESYALIHELDIELEPLWQALSACIGKIEERLSSLSSATIFSVGEVGGSVGISSSLPTGAPRVLPYIEAFFVLSDKLKVITPSLGQSELSIATACETKEAAGSLPSSSEMVMMSRSSSLQSRKSEKRGITFPKFAERHKRLLNAFLRQNPGLLEKSLSLLLRTPKLIDFDNKRAYFRAKIRQHHEQRHYAPLRISVRRAYVLEDSYNQLRMRTPDELKGRLTVQFQGEEGIDAGGLTREWYQLLSRVIFDKGALLFTTVGNDSTFQPNPNSVYQTEHLSYFRFVGRVVAKALFDGQLLDVYFTRSFYKHILGVKVTYHDIEAVDPDFYKNLKWVLENDTSDILGLTFSMDADEEKHILYEKNEVMDYELIPGGRNIRVTEENKHEYVDLVAEHRLTTAIRPQINEFLEGFNELISKDLISIFNDKELELLISGLPEIDLDDLKANTEYTGYTVATPVVQWFWEVVRAFNQEDMARLLQFVTGTSKVPLEGFRALQGISGPQRFQIHKAYGAPDRLPSAHTCFNQLDLPEYSSKEQLEERLLLAIHEGSEGFGFG